MLETALSGLVNTMSLDSISQIFTKLIPVIYYGTEMNALSFWVRRSKFKVMGEERREMERGIGRKGAKGGQ